MMPRLLTPILLGLRTVCAQEISGFTVYDAASDTALAPLGDNGSIDLAVYGNAPLTIRVEVNDPDGIIRFMRMNLNDGDTVRNDGAQPYFLGGDRAGDANGVNALSSPGSFTLQATALDGTFEPITEVVSIEFTVVNETMTVAVPEAPTPTPVLQNDFEGYRSSAMGTINGELRRWHKVTIGFQGILTSQRNNVENPFADLRLDVTFVHPASGTTYILPGFYACDGNAANTEATSGNVWLVHFRPDQVGTWEYTARYVRGANVAGGDDAAGTSAAYMDEAMGSFEILESEKVIPDLRAKGRLAAVGEKHLRFVDGDYFLKTEVDIGDSTETWGAFQDEYNAGDPTWMGGKGKGVMGLINYLSDLGVNGISLDGTDFIKDDNQSFSFRFDCRKTAEWDITLSHSESVGIAIQTKAIAPSAGQALDDGALGVQERLYYRELIARFGHHLSLSLKLGEDEDRLFEVLHFLEGVNSYRSPVAVQTIRGVEDAGSTLRTYEWAGISLIDPESVFDKTLEWLQDSGNGKKYVTLQSEDVSESIVALWVNLMAGGAGIEHSLASPDLRSQANMFLQSAHAVDFFVSHVPFWRMKSANSLVERDALCLADPDLFEHIVIYLPNGGTASLALANERTYDVRWYDPREGGDLQRGSITTLVAQDMLSSIGTPPYRDADSWTVLLKCTDCGLGDSVDSEPPIVYGEPALVPEEPILQSPLEPSEPVPIPGPSSSSGGVSLFICSRFIISGLLLIGL